MVVCTTTVVRSVCVRVCVLVHVLVHAYTFVLSTTQEAALI